MFEFKNSKIHQKIYQSQLNISFILGGILAVIIILFALQLNAIINFKQITDPAIVDARPPSNNNINQWKQYVNEFFKNIKKYQLYPGESTQYVGMTIAILVLTIIGSWLVWSFVFYLIWQQRQRQSIKQLRLRNNLIVNCLLLILLLTIVTLISILQENISNYETRVNRHINWNINMNFRYYKRTFGVTPAPYAFPDTLITFGLVLVIIVILLNLIKIVCLFQWKRQLINQQLQP